MLADTTEQLYRLLLRCSSWRCVQFKTSLSLRLSVNLTHSLDIVLFIYDSFITSDREVACFWTTKHPGGASLLFFANKWISMALYVMVFFSFASFPSDKSSKYSRMLIDVCSCSLFSIAIQAMVILQFVPGAAFSALRAYVLSRSKLFGLLVFSLALAPVGANLVHYGYQFSGENFPPFGCLDTDNTTAALDLKYDLFIVVISRVPLIAADILLIYITWTRLSTGSWGALRNIRQSKRLSLSEVLSQGGILCNTEISILFTLNVLHLIFSATAVSKSCHFPVHQLTFTDTSTGSHQ
ncbi:hypothetical protein C8T65DRAFT_598003 [Cerioporus squamosus]|nr:hypothetical protein C8T65DRAFT_598003 [Cerioporus squamosus]